MNIRHILEGLQNTVFVKEEIEKIAEERYAVCKTCKHNSSNSQEAILRPDEHCLKCKCNLHMKTRSLSSYCPIGLWASVSTAEEESLIDKALENEE